MSLENRMQIRLLPQSPVSCECKQPIRKRQAQSKRKDATSALLFAMAPCHYCLPQCIMQFQKVEQLVASNPYRQASQLCPLSPASRLTTAPASRALPSRWVSSPPPTVRKCWHAVVPRGSPRSTQLHRHQVWLYTKLKAMSTTALELSSLLGCSWRIHHSKANSVNLF